MANADSDQDIPDVPEERTRWEVEGPQMLQILIKNGRSHDFLAGLSILLAAHGVNTESLKGPALDAIVRREGIENVQLISRADAAVPGEFSQMHISVSVSRILLANLLRSCMNVAVHQRNVKFVEQAIEFSRAFGITIGHPAQA